MAHLLEQGRLLTLALAPAQVLMDNVRRELEPGLGISRLSRDDYLRFLRLGAFFTAYVRGKQVLRHGNLPVELQQAKCFVHGM